MTSFYLATALLIAISLNHRRPPVRAIGHVLAGLALAMIAASIILANLDGTFAASPSAIKPWLLNAQALLAILAAGALFWAAPKALKRPPSPGLGHTPLTRTLHWTSAALIIAAYPMGQFISILSPKAPERAEFLATHLAIGAAVFALTAARLINRLITRPAATPPTPLKSMAAHTALYALILAISLTGLALTTAPVSLYGLSFPRLPPSANAEALHRVWLPILLAALLAAHLTAAATTIRRMAT